MIEFIESTIVLSEVLLLAGAEISYVYDFGDNWRHLIELEEIIPAQPEGEYPRVIDGVRSCPPEDSGGTTGYTNLLEILSDPTHEECEDMRGWEGEKFNADVFSLKEVNRRLRRNRSLGPRV